MNQPTANSLPPSEAPAIAPGARERAGIGPGLVFALAVIGAGDYVSNVAIGATHGVSLLWTLLVAAICRYVWVAACSRYVLVTGETPFQGFARLSRALLWIILATLIVHRHVHGLYHVLFMGTSIHLLLPLPTSHSATLWSLFFVAVGFSLMFWSGYRRLEILFKLLMAFMGGSLVFIVVLAPPPLTSILKGLFIPVIPDVQGLYSTALLLTALLGTEACSMSNITYSYFMWQKGWRDLSFLPRQRRDLLYGIAAMFLMGAFLQIAAAGSLSPSAGAPSSAEDLVRIFSARLGFTGRAVFALGIWAAVFTSFIGGISGYSMAIADIIRTSTSSSAPILGRSREESRRDPLFRALVVFFSFSPLYILYTSVRPVWLVLVASAASVLTVPVVSLALLRLTSSRRYMGSHRNHWAVNAVLLFLVALSSYFIYRNAMDILHRFNS